MRRVSSLLVLALMTVASAFAQTTNAVTTLTTLQNGPSQKAIYVTLAAADENGMVGSVLVDNRSNAQGPLGFLTISSVDFTGAARGKYTGFTGNPDGTRHPFTGQAIYFGTGYTPDGRVFNLYGVFNYHATFVGSCNGRGCPQYGWHYSIDAGSMASAVFPDQIL